MSDTPRTDAWKWSGGDDPMGEFYKFARQLERELSAANERIKQLEAVNSDPHALWTNWLRGTVKLPEGIGDVRQCQERIKQLEQALSVVCGGQVRPLASKQKSSASTR